MRYAGESGGRAKVRALLLTVGVGVGVAVVGCSDSSDAEVDAGPRAGASGDPNMGASSPGAGADGGGGQAPAGSDGGSAAGDGAVPPGDDPAPGEYGHRAPLLEANSEMAVAELEGKIYVLGGYPSSREVQTTVQVYDPQTDSWIRAAALPQALHHPVVVGATGKLYSLGGQTDGGDGVDSARRWRSGGETGTPGIPSRSFSRADSCEGVTDR